MDLNYLEFEQPIAELLAKIEELRRIEASDQGDLDDEINRLEKKCDKLTKSIFTSLTPWQVTQMARHPQRPYLNDYIPHLFTDFEELHGDRMYANDYAIVAGVARFDDEPVMVIGHQKGRTTEAKIKRNFGMPRPEGYRKTQRLMKMAEKFNMPVFTFIDTPGAYPGVGAEERGQSEAIASSLKIMAALKTPIISTVIGEGGSGGALAIGVSDRLLMMQYSVYSVISPEGCASILWKSAARASDAAQAMALTSKDILKTGISDEVIPEPVGGAHREIISAANNVKQVLRTHYETLKQMPIEELLKARRQRMYQYGVFDSASK